MSITEEMMEDCKWLAQRGEILSSETKQGIRLILDADWTALELEDKTVRVDIFTYIACVKHDRDLREIIAHGPFQNFLFFKERWEIDGGFYQDFADLDDVLTEHAYYHDKLTCADYAKTLLGYIVSGGKKRIDWGWLNAKLDAGIA